MRTTTLQQPPGKHATALTSPRPLPNRSRGPQLHAASHRPGRATARAAAAHGERSALLRAVRAWLGLGLLAVVLLPAARGDSAWLGWMPFWLVLAPLSMLAVAEHARLSGAVKDLLAGRRRRPRTRRAQARVLAGAQRNGQRRARAA